MKVTKTHTDFKIEEAKPFSVPDDAITKMKDKKWKVSIVDKSGFGMAIYLDAHDLIVVNCTVAKIIKEYFLEEHVNRGSGNGEDKKE